MTDADREWLTASDCLAAVRAEESRAAVAAYRALGGGWSAAPGPVALASAEAAAALRTEGPDRLGVRAVMNRVRLTHGGFYAHFKSKDDLLTEAVG